jgi:hypothetical protein
VGLPSPEDSGVDNMLNTFLSAGHPGVRHPAGIGPPAACPPGAPPLLHHQASRFTWRPASKSLWAFVPLMRGTEAHNDDFSRSTGHPARVKVGNGALAASGLHQ